MGMKEGYGLRRFQDGRRYESGWMDDHKKDD
jgi:hypothetical protein